MICKCGYVGSEYKMSFDIDEAYAYLCEHGLVYTIRPVFGKEAVVMARVHLHRGGRWTKQLAEKQLITEGKGRDELLKVLANPSIPLVEKSGFASQGLWLGKLSTMHGSKVTTFHWAIYLVKLD